MEEEKKKKKSSKKKYLLYALFVLVATGLALWLSLKDCFFDVIDAFKNANIPWVFATIGIVLFYILLNALILLILVRIYTRKYHYRSAIATVLIGEFYSGITPGSSGGQPMQAYTMHKQGVEISNAASILVLFFILYQFALVAFGAIGLIVKYDQLMAIGAVTFNLNGNDITLPLIPLIIIGFGINLVVIFGLLLMAYSKRLHNFIMNHGVNIGTKLKLIKNPEKTRENLRVKVENFRMELKRLQSNIPLSIFLFILFLVFLTAKFSVPWFAGGILNGLPEDRLNFGSMLDASFLSSFHQMVTGLIPIPGAAGVSELFYSIIFNGFFTKPEFTSASQIIWRVATFHLPLIIGGFTSAFYKASPKENIELANSQTFIDLQHSTFEKRKASYETLYETNVLNKDDIRKRLDETLFLDDSNVVDTTKKKAEPFKLFKKKEQNKPETEEKKVSAFVLNRQEKKKLKQEQRKLKQEQKHQKDDEEGWGTIDF